MKSLKIFKPNKTFYFILCFVILFQLTVEECSISSLESLQNDIYNQNYEIKRFEACFWYNISNKGYFFDSSPRNYSEAEELCNYYDAVIAHSNVKSVKDRRYLLEVLGINKTNTRFWMPLSKTNGSFFWPDQQIVNDTDIGWMNGEPNDSGGDENCVHTNYKMNSIQDINDVPCSFHEPTICEITCNF